MPRVVEPVAVGAVPATPGRGNARRVVGKRRGRTFWTPVLSVVGVLLIAELAVRTGLVNARYFPPMTETLSVLGQQAVSASFWGTVWATLQGWAIGLGLGGLIGVPLGILLGSYRLLWRASRLTVEFLRPVPSVALIPVAILIFGAELESKVFLAAYASMWPILIQTLYGVQGADPVVRDTARSFGYKGVPLLVRTTLPGAAPYIMTGLRISSAIALILAVTAELVIGNPGLGRTIAAARGGGAIALMYATIIATGLLGWALNIGMTRLERSVLHWHPSQRERIPS